jgi:protease-4
MIRVLFTVLLNLFRALVYPFQLLARRLFRRSHSVAISLRVRGALPYLAPPQRRPWLFRLLQRGSPHDDAEPDSLRALQGDFAALARRPEVKAVVLHLEGFSGSGAALSGLLEALAPLRAAGKPVYGYSRMAMTGEVRLLSQLDRLYLGPGGRLELVGYAAEVYSLRDALAKVGVRPQFVRRGEFKTAPEMFTASKISPAQAQTLDAILDERMAVLVESIATGRKLGTERAREAIDAGPYSARRAIAAGLADAISDPRGIEELLKKEHGEKLSVIPYGAVEGARLPRPRFKPVRRPDHLAVVPVRGLINIGEGRGGRGPTVAGSDSVIRALEQAGEQARAKAVLLYVDSRGGSAIASELIHAAVLRLGKEKPVFAYCDEVAASGGYMAAVGAQQFWCAPESIVGSIGVFAGKFDVEGLLGMLAVGVDERARGRHAGLYSLSRAWTPEELAVMESSVEETYRDFLRIVAAGRKMSEEAVHAVAEGRVFTGTRALEKNLVDGTCSHAEALQKVLALGKLGPDAPLSWIDPSPSRPSPLELLRPALSEKLWMVDLSRFR